MVKVGAVIKGGAQLAKDSVKAAQAAKASQTIAQAGKAASKVVKGTEGAASVVKGVSKGAGRAYKAAKGTRNQGQQLTKVGEYTFTNTAATHLSKRPYMNSSATIINIMKSGKGVPDIHFKGGVNYKVPGKYGTTKGVWELGINPETNVIYHFLFRKVK